MLVRSSSTRRTRAPSVSRNAGLSPQATTTTTGMTMSAVAVGSLPVSRVRRASVATEKQCLGQTTFDSPFVPRTGESRQRSPRGSIAVVTPLQPCWPPDISLEDLPPDDRERVSRRLLPDPELARARNSLVPGENYSRSPRGSLVPPETNYNRSPRNSLVPSSAATGFGINDNNSSEGPLQLPRSISSPRGSVSDIPTFEKTNQRSNSICPEMPIRSPRGSIVPAISTDRIDVSRSPRGSICPEQMSRTPRGSIISEYQYGNRSPRGSLCPSIDADQSPRGSNSVLASQAYGTNDKSPRSSTICGGPPTDYDLKTPRSSIGGGPTDIDRSRNKSPRGSVEIDRSPRGSLGGQERRTRALTPQDPRRASADQGTTTMSNNRNSSPYRQRDAPGNGGTGSGSRTTGNSGPQTNLGYGTNAWADSRRASSSVSQMVNTLPYDLSKEALHTIMIELKLQFSGDESRRLCGGVIDSTEKVASGGSSGPLGVATYGTLVFQLKDAHREASGTFDFVFRAMRVVGKTMLVTVCLACLSTMPIIMLIMGQQFIRECPKEPNIPIYMVVGGSLGSLRMFWALYSQIRSRRLEIISVPNTGGGHISPMQLVSIALSFFLSIWFVLGNYWILRIRWPEYEPKPFDPDQWCDKKLYIFSLVHLGIVYAAIAANIITAIFLAICRFFACPWFERYK